MPELDLPQRSLPKADARCLSVAAASVVAKVERDQLMTALEQDFPGYGFARHKGYGTRAHRQALERLGPSPLHWLTWRPLRINCILFSASVLFGQFSPRFYLLALWELSGAVATAVGLWLDARHVTRNT